MQKFHQEHLWVNHIDDDTVLIGVSDFAQQSLGEIMYLDLPEIGTEIKQGVSLGTIESAKVVSELIAPINGKIIALNDALEEEPWIVNEDAEGKGWIARINLDKPEDINDLLTKEEYQKELGIEE